MNEISLTRINRILDESNTLNTVQYDEFSTWADVVIDLCEALKSNISDISRMKSSVGAIFDD